MGIFGALTTAVSGLRAQSYALENISGNIANSQTTAFKRTDTSFTDLIPDALPSRQVAGAVISQSRATNSVQGDIQSASSDTYMALNGEGYFVVATQAGTSDGQPVFSGTDYYTRRGDFSLNKEGYLVNEAGYYLKLLPIDRNTGAVSGSVPQVMTLNNDVLPARATEVINYRAKLPKNTARGVLDPSAYPVDPRALHSPLPIDFLGGVVATPGNLGGAVPTALTLRMNNVDDGAGQPVTFMIGDNPAVDTLQDLVDLINAHEDLDGIQAEIVGGNQLRLFSTNENVSLEIGGAAQASLGLGAVAATVSPTYSLQSSAEFSNPNDLIASGITSGDSLTINFNEESVSFPITSGGTDTLAELATAINAHVDLDGLTATVEDGRLVFSSTLPTDTLTVTGAAADAFGFDSGYISATDYSLFEGASISGGAVTIYDAQGTPSDVLLRWAKVNSSEDGGVDTWNLFYQTDSTATGDEPAWRNVGTNFTFVDGVLTPPAASTTVPNMVVDGVELGDIQISHGTTGLTQYNSDNPTNVEIQQLNQDGYAAGVTTRIQISEGGRITAFYSNGQMADIAEIPTVYFNADNQLKRLDGGAFATTFESGPPIPGAPGTIIGQSLEGSNTDIADEFTKLIITQQAYSANTRIVSTADEMLQEALNMIR